MKTFKIDLEATVSNKGKLKIPPELVEVYVMSKMKWTASEYRAQPEHVIDKLLFLWHLENVAQEAQNRKK